VTGADLEMDFFFWVSASQIHRRATLVRIAYVAYDSCLLVMGRKKTTFVQRAARARSGRHKADHCQQLPTTVSDSEDSSGSPRSSLSPSLSTLASESQAYSPTRATPVAVVHTVIDEDYELDPGLEDLEGSELLESLERGLFRKGLKMRCGKDTCSNLVPDCCATRILANQPDFKEQRSLVQEVIENAGHICIFLPKFHCELNFIEYFWGAVKRYLREHCDYSFPTLQANLPKAMASVPITTIRKWENRTWRWIDAYDGGLDAKGAQMQVKAFSSRVYSSHRRTSEMVGRRLDNLSG
jgi:hypothetical protein